jgi:predicted outer membrane repeat protein
MENAGTSLVMVNCAVADNSCSYGNGGLTTVGTTTVTGCTFTDNGGFYSGGAIESSGTLTLTNDILYGNASSYGGSSEVENSGTASASHCDIDETLGTGGDGVTDDGNNIDSDPELEDSPTNLQIGRRSPCLGAGTTSAPDYFNYDINGQPRSTPPSIGAYDAGAVDTGSTANTLTLASSANPSTFPPQSRPRSHPPTPAA